VKCDQCVAEGVTSRLYSKGSTATCMGFEAYYDEDGQYHRHDPNRHSDYFECSNGHKFSRTYKMPCPCPQGCEYGHEPVVVVPS
jgi:hypothetical protein